MFQGNSSEETAYLNLSVVLKLQLAKARNRNLTTLRGTTVMPLIILSNAL